MTLSFRILHHDQQARTGLLTTKHGIIHTPCFMAVGTAGTVKAMTIHDIEQTKTEIILGNTYHLMLRPGAKLIEKMGGLHQFMNWQRPILTDSGGYQIMSLSKLRKLHEYGVVFSSHINGEKHILTPEHSITIQHQLGSTITMCLDECTPYPCTIDEARKSMLLSMRWAKKSKNAYQEREGYGLFGIMQGSVFEELRKESMAYLHDIGFDGYAIGGLAVGEGQKIMLECLDFITPTMPKTKPRYLMGVGKPSDLVEAVWRGIDMFDCVLPTRSGRNGQLFSRYGTINIKNARHKNDNRPIDETCPCRACQHHSRAYLHHLYKCSEILGVMLMTQHNVTYYQQLMQSLRDAIQQGTLQQHRAMLYNQWQQGDIDPL